MKLFLLRDIETKEFLSLSVRSNDSEDFCNETTCELDVDSYTQHSPWVTTDLVNAWYVKSGMVGWYNSSVETPCHNFKPEELEIVCFTSNQDESIVDIEMSGINDFLYNKRKENAERDDEIAQLDFVYTNFVKSGEKGLFADFYMHNNLFKEWIKNHTIKHNKN